MILPRLGERFLNLPKMPDLSVDRPEQNFRQKINEFHGNVNGSFFRTHCLIFLFFFWSTVTGELLPTVTAPGSNLELVRCRLYSIPPRVTSNGRRGEFSFAVAATLYKP